MYEFQLFLIMSMPFLIILCNECNPKTKENYYSPECHHEYRDEKYRNVYIEMDVLMLACEIVQERLDI